MFDINEIRKRAQQASEQASASVKKTIEKSEELIDKIEACGSEENAFMSADEVEEQIAANTGRQAEILEQLFGEEMGVLAAALETLEMEDADEEEELSFDLEREENLYTILEAAIDRLEAMPEPEAIPYQKDDEKWERFGILLSGILSALNSHNLDCMDVEEHIPVMEQKIVSLVRRSWGINGRSDLLDMIRYLAQEGYILRYQLYSEAAAPEESFWRSDVETVVRRQFRRKLSGLSCRCRHRPAEWKSRTGQWTMA